MAIKRTLWFLVIIVILTACGVKPDQKANLATSPGA